MKQRHEIEDKYKWDLSVLYKNSDEYKKAFEEIKALGTKILDFKGRLNTKENILSEFILSTKMSRILERMEVYLSLRKETNGADKEVLEELAELENYLTDFAAESAFVTPELAKLDDAFIDEMIASKEFEDYDIELKDLKEEKKHILDETREKMLAKIGSFAGFSEIFSKIDDIEIKFDKIVLEDGSEVEITNENYGLFTHDRSQRVRRDAFLALHRGFKGLNLTISENFLNFLKYCDTMAEFRNYNGTFEKRMQSSKIDKSVVFELIRHVNEHLPSFFAYAKALKKCLGLETMYNIDVYAPVTTDKNQRLYEFDEGAEIVKQALAPMGQEYIAILNKLLQSRTIDVYPTENKGGGGFSCGCYDTLPFILLNYNGTHSDVSTLAHELGHSMHTYFSQNAQCYEKSGYDIFVAEIASTVNEILLFKYMEQHAKSNAERKSYIANFLSTFYATVMRQTMFSEFELFVHESTRKRVPLTYDKLNTEYGKLQKKYFGDDIVMLENADVEWSRIPHFYRPFYVYKYATGFVSACSIVSNIMEKGEDYVKNYYMKFLSAGGSLDPVDILALADVDITSAETYNKAFGLYDHYIEEFDRL